MKLFIAILCSYGGWLAHGLTVMPPKVRTAEHIPLAKEAMEFLDNSPDPFHAVQTAIGMLEDAGFTEVQGIEPYSNKIKPGGKYYFTRNKSTLVAFAVGGKFAAGVGGFKVIGGHTDSPNLKVKPRSKRSDKTSKSIQIGAECYGGGLWHTWFDRDLGLSGRVFLRQDDGRIVQQLIKIDRAILRIPNLAIHLVAEADRKAFAVNKEDHLSPILAGKIEEALTGAEAKDGDDDKKEKDKDKTTKDGWTEHQEPLLVQLLADELGVNTSAIVDFELNMYDIQKAALGGVQSEFLYSARLDNLASCFLAIKSLLSCLNEENFLENDKDINMVVLYDHEEVGSASAVGAAGPILGETVKSISVALDADKAIESIIRKSFVISSDQAHALHPNYAARHEKNHQPHMNAGMVIKRNSNQRYATTSVSGVLIREVARRASLPPVQEFVIRQDCGCGSTIGPLIATATGIRAIDMGCPQLSMHSIREQMGICDLTHALALFTAFFKHFREVDDAVQQ